jgi:hypothetical protein
MRLAPDNGEIRGVTLKRSRGRGRRPQNNNNHNRSFDSAGPDIKIRGTASQVYEKYLQLARDANSSGDRIQAESYLQHAEHYYRIVMASQPPPGAPVSNGGEQRPANGEGAPQGSAPSFSLAEGTEDEEVA